MTAITTVISDFGGVLTTPLIRSFAAVQDRTGIPVEALGRALGEAAKERADNPLFELERGEISEAEFLEVLGAKLADELDHEPELHSFREIYFEALDPNEPMIELMREAKAAGMTMALLTNNVREWEPLWRSMLPVDEIFETIVDSAFVGLRKPDPAIYELTLERLGNLPPEQALFIDDTEHNADAARELGIAAVHFRSNEQAIPEIREALGL